MLLSTKLKNTINLNISAVPLSIQVPLNITAPYPGPAPIHPWGRKQAPKRLGEQRQAR